jgi:hypothetical protein
MVPEQAKRAEGLGEGARAYGASPTPLRCEPFSSLALSSAEGVVGRLIVRCDMRESKA